MENKMWSIKEVNEDYFHKYYLKVKRERYPVTIQVLFENTTLDVLTTKDVLKGDIVSVYLKDTLCFGVVTQVNKGPTSIINIPKVVDGYYDSLNKERSNYELGIIKEESLPKKEVFKSEEKFFERITSEYDDYKIFFYKTQYIIDYDYKTHDNVLKKYELNDKTPHYTKLKIRPGDLVVDNQYIGIISYVAEPRQRHFINDYAKDMLFFRGDDDKEGKKVLEKYKTRRNTLTKELLAPKFLTSGNHITLINHHEAKATLPNGKEVTFRVCRSLNDMLNKISIYKPDLLPLLMDENGDYHDSHFASEQVINNLVNNYIEKVSFESDFDSLLKHLISFVKMFGYTKEIRHYDYLKEKEYRTKMDADTYLNRCLWDTHFAGVNLAKNFANDETFCFDTAPFYINPENRDYYFSKEKAYGLTIYNRASNPLKIKYHNQTEYSERTGYYSVGGYWELEDKVIESYAILCLNDNPPVFYEKFYEENIIFELDGYFYAYYVFREKGINNYLDPTEIFNNPVAYYLSKQRIDYLYGHAHQINSDKFDGVFLKDCTSLNDAQCTAIYYSYDDIKDLPEVNEHFYKDQTGIYSKDGKILYFAFNENTRQYVVREGVEEIRSYAFAYLKRVDTIILSNSVKKIGSLVEPISKTKAILCPKLKTVVVPEAMIRDNIIDRCITGPNLSKQQLKEIELLIRE